MWIFCQMFPNPNSDYLDQLSVNPNNLEKLSVQFIFQKIYFYHFIYPYRMGPLITTILQMVVNLLKVLQILGSRAWIELGLFASRLTIDYVGCPKTDESSAVAIPFSLPHSGEWHFWEQSLGPGKHLKPRQSLVRNQLVVPRCYSCVKPQTVSRPRHFCFPHSCLNSHLPF